MFNNSPYAAKKVEEPFYFYRKDRKEMRLFSLAYFAENFAPFAVKSSSRIFAEISDGFRLKSAKKIEEPKKYINLRRIMKRIIFTAMCISLIFSGMAYARTYKIGMTGWAGWSPNNVADVKGFWKALGLDVQVIVLANNQELDNAFINRRVDIANEMIGTWVGLYSEGIPLKIIAELDWSHGGDKIIAKKDFDIKKLKGQMIGVYLNQPPVFFFLNKYLEANMLRLSDVRIVELDAEGLADNFIAGRFPMIVDYDPHAIRAEQQGNGRITATSATYPGCIPEGYAIHEDALKEIPVEELVKIFKGWIEAVKWIKDEKNWEEYKKILNTKTFEGGEPYSDKDLKEMCDAVSIHNEKMLLERNKNNSGLAVYLNELKAMLKENNMLKKEFKPEEIFDNTAIKEALQGVQ